MFRKTSPNTSYYEILGVSKNASQDELTNAYRKASMMNLPEKGGDTEKFLDLAHSYEVLSNPERREIYDQYGEPRRRLDVVCPLMVSLEDLFKGTSKKLQASRRALCSKCKGKGSKSGASVKCSCCRGSGMKLFIRHLGPQMIHLPRPCDVCKGTGEIISKTVNDEDRCEQCKGEMVFQEKKVLEVHVEKGMQNGQKITFSEQALDTVT